MLTSPMLKGWATISTNRETILILTFNFNFIFEKLNLKYFVKTIIELQHINYKGF
jgi:hypothetical protein